MECHLYVAHVPETKDRIKCTTVFQLLEYIHRGHELTGGVLCRNGLPVDQSVDGPLIHGAEYRYSHFVRRKTYTNTSIYTSISRFIGKSVYSRMILPT